MRRLLTIALLILSLTGRAEIWYLAPATATPAGNDANAGTSAAAPMFTLIHAWTHIGAGDTLYLRGGTYAWNASQILSGKNGTATDTIRVLAYPGEHPVFTRGPSFTGDNWGLVRMTGDYTHWRDIEITGMVQTGYTTVTSGFVLTSSSNNKIERINSHGNGHGMLLYSACGNNLILNCDFHHNYDPNTTDPAAYGNADGLELESIPDGYNNTIRGCRAWRNSDDGYDTWDSDGYITYENCWAWHNGYRENGTTTGGDGNGFKLGTTDTNISTKFARKVQNCVSFLNRSSGYTTNNGQCLMYFLNSIAYDNGFVGFQVTGYETLAFVFKNLISAENQYNFNAAALANAVTDSLSYHATWQPTGPAITSADFISVDSTGVSGARQSNGNLPVLTYLHLAAASDCKDRGITDAFVANDGDGVKRGYLPDLGAYEIEDIRIGTIGGKAKTLGGGNVVMIRK